MPSLRQLFLTASVVLGSAHAAAEQFFFQTYSPSPASLTHWMGGEAVSQGTPDVFIALALSMDTGPQAGVTGQITIADARWHSEPSSVPIDGTRYYFDPIDYRLSAPLSFDLSTETADWNPSTLTLNVTGQLTLTPGSTGVYQASGNELLSLYPTLPGPTSFRAAFRLSDTSYDPGVFYNLLLVQDLSEQLLVALGVPNQLTISQSYCTGTVERCMMPLESPLPASSWLLGSALLGLGALRRGR